MLLKRLFDIFVSILVLFFIWPFLLVLAALIRNEFGSPIFFRQNRTGLHGKIFEIIKFRTMLDAQDAEGNQLPDDQRLTKLGAFLRNMSMDELPELFNVLNGEMSLVGPRPLLPEYLPLYTLEQARRHDVKPGITGWAQVNGRNAISWEDKFALDVWYVDNRSFFLDMKIICITFLKVFKREGISHEGCATMTKFYGNNGEKDKD
jgi:lipopolysaccharide/colanic/teichoic acid biosynthesis glycosyltransferase